MRFKMLLGLLILSASVACESSLGTVAEESVSSESANRNAGQREAGLRNVDLDARTHPEAPPPESPSSNFVEEHPGSPERECVYVNSLLNKTGGHGAVRSGELVAGPFTYFVRGWVPENENKLWFAPLHTEEMPGLTIRAMPPASPGKAHTVEYRNVAWTTTDGEPFYPGEIRLPEAGAWRLIATSGPDWGCFELTLPG